jgi:hypothetical protein
LRGRKSKAFFFEEKAEPAPYAKQKSFMVWRGGKIPAMAAEVAAA